jgi:hypothetical protein
MLKNNSPTQNEYNLTPFRQIFRQR